MAESDNKPKGDEKPKAFPAPGRPVKMPTAPAGTAWDTVVIGQTKAHPGYEFAYLAAGSIEGIRTLSRGNDKVAAGLFNRAVRIALPARLDARKLIADAKTAEARTEVLVKLQTALLDFDLSKVQERAVRAPVDLSDVDMDDETRKLVEAKLRAAGVKIA